MSRISHLAFLVSWALSVLAEDMRYLSIHACLYKDQPGLSYSTKYENRTMEGHTNQVDNPMSAACLGSTTEVTFGRLEVPAAKNSKVNFEVEVTGAEEERRACVLVVGNWPSDKELTWLPWYHHDGGIDNGTQMDTDIGKDQVLAIGCATLDWD